MSLPDCPKCWDISCCCWYKYKDYTKEALSKHIANITRYRTKEEAKSILVEAIKLVDNSENWKQV